MEEFNNLFLSLKRMSPQNPSVATNVYQVIQYCKLGVILLLLTPVAKLSQTQKLMYFKPLGFCVYRLRQRLQCVHVGIWELEKIPGFPTLPQAHGLKTKQGDFLFWWLVTLGCLKSPDEEPCREPRWDVLPSKAVSLLLECPASILCCLQLWEDGEALFAAGESFCKWFIPRGAPSLCEVRNPDFVWSSPVLSMWIPVTGRAGREEGSDLCR